MKRIGSAAFVALVAATPALADFRVCNRSSETVTVAAGWRDPGDGWIAQGWWTLPSGACELTIPGGLPSRYVYVFAQGDRGGLWRTQRDQAGGWFCTRPGRFRTVIADHGVDGRIDCARDGLVARQFRAVDTGDARRFTFDLRD